jgi:hypothetical protein
LRLPTFHLILTTTGTTMNRRIAHLGAAALFLAGWILCFVPKVVGQEPRVEMRYPLGPDSMRHDDVPRGEVTTHEWNDSKVFPNTKREYYVYVPAQYDRNKSAALPPSNALSHSEKIKGLAGVPLRFARAFVRASASSFIPSLIATPRSAITASGCGAGLRERFGADCCWRAALVFAVAIVVSCLNDECDSVHMFTNQISLCLVSTSCQQ